MAYFLASVPSLRSRHSTKRSKALPLGDLSARSVPFDMPDPHTAQSPSPIRIARRFRPGGNEETGHHWHPFTLGHGAQDGIEGVINLFAKK